MPRQPTTRLPFNADQVRILETRKRPGGVWELIWDDGRGGRTRTTVPAYAFDAALLPRMRANMVERLRGLS
jgi:hypothetical protein